MVYYFLSLVKAIYAGVAELADALDSGSSVTRRGGSSPLFRTTIFNGYSIAFLMTTDIVKIFLSNSDKIFKKVVDFNLIYML